MTFFDDLVNMAVRVMRNNATYEHKLILRLLINIAVRGEIMPSPNPTGQTENKKEAHAKIVTGPLHKSELEAREAVHSKTDLKSVPDAFQANTKEPKRKPSPTHSCANPGHNDYQPVFV